MARIRDFTVTEQTTASTNPSAVVEYPVHETNDLILLYMAVDGTTVPSLPSGYTDIQNQAGTAQAYRLCYKVATSSSETCPTLSGASDEWHITVIAVEGADTADPINVTAERTTTDNASPFTWSHGQSTDETNVLVFQFINSDTGLAMMANPPWTNLQNGDAGTAGGSVAYTFLPSIGAIPNCDWRGRANDDTTACLVGINDDGNGKRPAYADPTSVGQLLHPLHAGTIESTVNVNPLTFPFIACRNFTQAWEDNAGVFTDETTDMLDSGTADVTITNTVANAWYFGYDYTFRSMILTISTASVGGTIVWEYWNGTAWTSFTMSGVLTATGNVRFSWAALSGWAATSVNGVSKYYIRMRISVVFTTAPVLSEGHVGGRLTTYDAVAAAGDAGINPYQDAMSLTPASTSNFAGSEVQFGSAFDMDTGVVILHHKSQLPRDYAVDVSANDVTYPITDVPVNCFGGFVIVFADADGDYEAYSIHSKGALSNSVVDWNVAAIGINDGAQAYGIIRGSLDKSAITRMLFLPCGANGAMLAHVSQLSIVSKLVVAGGNDDVPIDNDDLVLVANRAFGHTLLFNGIGTYYRVYCPMEIGGGDPVYLDIDGITYAMPTKFDGKKFLDWNADDNVAGFKFYGKTGDQIKFTNCTWIGSQPYRWEFNASHVAGTENFAGTKVQGATVTLVSTVALDDVSFVNCPSFTLGGADLENCSFTNTKVSAATLADMAGISDCSFTKTTGTSHAIEVSGSAAEITLTGCTFTGYAGSDGSTGNEAIYVNIASGTVTINISGGDTPSIRTAGATVTVNNNVTVTLTGLQNPSEVRVFLAGTTNEVSGTGAENVTTGSHAFSIGSGVEVDISVLSLGYQNLRILAYSTTGDAELPITQVLDRQYANA